MLPYPMGRFYGMEALSGEPHFSELEGVDISLCFIIYECYAFLHVGDFAVLSMPGGVLRRVTPALRSEDA